MTVRTYREASRTDWHRSDGGQPNLEQVTLGAMQRIADAAEKMAQRHTELIGERDWYERKYKQEQAANRRLCYQLRGAKGAQTRQLKKLREESRRLESDSHYWRRTVAFAFETALKFACKNVDRSDAQEFLTLWLESGRWEPSWRELDAKFPAWKNSCAECSLDPRAPL